MITVEDLTGIEKDKRDEIIKNLNDLMSLVYVDKNNIATSLITGYNLYPKTIPFDRTFSLSNMHKTENYKENMIYNLLKLGYSKDTILKGFRSKIAAYLWFLNFEMRGNDGRIYGGLKIRDIRTGGYLDLNKYGKTLASELEFKDARDKLIAEDSIDWELNLPFSSRSDVRRLMGLFAKKGSSHIYDSNGVMIRDDNPDKWVDAYDTPIIIFGEKAVDYFKRLKHFSKAIRVFLEENGNEVNFIVHKTYPALKDTFQYCRLIENFGFKVEGCLANKPFLRYIDMMR